jgi:hypothetical protein
MMHAGMILLFPAYYGRCGSYFFTTKGFGRPLIMIDAYHIMMIASLAVDDKAMWLPEII